MSVKSFLSLTTNAHKTYYLHLPVEDTKVYKTRRQASTASCLFVGSGTDKVDSSQFKLYRCPVSGSVVGLATTDPKSGSDVPVVWLEVSHTKKGVYFSAACLSDTSKRFSASIKKTINTSEKKRTARFIKYIRLLEGKDPSYIWEWWLTGFSGVECSLRMEFM
ncbi:hypothetical protein AX14_013075 [Amanita brunnescens Koide BX004]|nr:hypothetical protein AX14_013075 [Amanita brunnescens Koide BX004]